MTPDIAALRRRSRWVKAARPNQLIPRNDACSIHLFLAGRGFGKTKLAAEDSWWWAYENPGTITHVIAPTHNDLRFVCFEGESGLLSCIPYELLDGGLEKAYNKSFSTLNLTNGAVFRGFSATEPNRLRGPQCHRLWGDEVAAWENVAGNMQAAYDMAMFGLRLGANAEAVLTTTPKPLKLIRDLVKDKRVRVVRGSTYENLANLAKNFQDNILQYEGTKIGRQEIYAELLDPEEGGIVTRSMWKLWPANKPLPKFSYIVLSMDTAFTEKTIDRKSKDADPTAASVWGVFHEDTSKFSHGNRQRTSKGYAILLDCWQEMLGFPDLITRAADEMSKAYGASTAPLVVAKVGPKLPEGSGRKPDLFVLEDKGSGISLRQTLATQGIIAHPYNPGNASKISRLHMVSHVFQAGLIYAVESSDPKRAGQPRNWADPLIEQLATFRGEGSIQHDDLLDTTTQAIRVMLDKQLLTVEPPRAIVERRAEEERDRIAFDGLREDEYSNPYAA